MNSYIIKDGTHWLAVRMGESGRRVWPCSHMEYFAPATLDGARAVSYYYSTRRAAQRHAARYGEYCGELKNVERS